MPEQSTPMRARVTNDPRVVVIDSYDFNLCVCRGHVVVRSGKNERVISRMDAAKTRDGVARIIILSRVGTVSAEVMRWASALDIAISQVARDGSILFTSPGAESSDGRIIRQQVLAGEGMPNAHYGLALTRALLAEKLRGQRDIACELFRADTSIIDTQIEALKKAESLRTMLAIEGNTANPYWRLWKECVFVPWELDAMRYIPGHWARFGSRAGIQTIANGYSSTSNRNATDFVNACLNYAYGIAKTEALYACHIRGLHPSIGIAHGTHDGMPGMALDLVEPLRPIVDRIVLTYLDCGHGIPFDDTGKPAYIDKKYAYEENDGTCRLSVPMTTRLASVVPMAVASKAVEYAELAIRTIAPNVRKGRLPRDTRTELRPVTAGKLTTGITVADLIPDTMWNAVYPHMPVRHVSGKAVDERTVLAGIAANNLYGVSWPDVEVLGIDSRTCRSRLATWKDLGCWEKIRAEICKPGFSQYVNSQSSVLVRR
jgi:CRISP-associated protein Cas1